MNQRQIGAIVIIVGVLLSIFVFMVKSREDTYINSIVDETGSCYLQNGTCLHKDRDFGIYIFGGVISTSLIMLGIYLMFFDKTQKILAQQSKEVSEALKEVKHKEEFNAFLSGFNEEEQTVLKAVQDQEGIHQSTLRYRTGISKTALSLLLHNLEEREIVSRKVSGKTKEVYLLKKF